jgi:hypothetical protein
MHTPTLTPPEARVLLDNLDYGAIARLPDEMNALGVSAKQKLVLIEHTPPGETFHVILNMGQNGVNCLARDLQTIIAERQDGGQRTRLAHLLSALEAAGAKL